MGIGKMKLILTSEKELLNRCRKSLKRLPKGGLTCFSRGGKLYYKKNEQSAQTYLGSSDNPEVQKLKKRHLLEKMIMVLEKNITLLEKLVKGYRECNPYILQKQFRKAYQDIDPEMIRDLGYIANPVQDSFREEEKLYKTTSGLMVRSRIEALIADIYTQKGYLFEYEPVLYFKDGSFIRPDFKVYAGPGNIVKYHEHIGLLSDEKYLKGYLWKMERYIKEGYYPFYDVLFTYEKEGEGIDLVEIASLIDIFLG